MVLKLMIIIFIIVRMYLFITMLMIPMLQALFPSMFKEYYAQVHLNSHTLMKMVSILISNLCSHWDYLS